MPEDLNLVNKLYYSDNLFIMREFIPDECVDLIYLGYAANPLYFPPSDAAVLT